MLDYNKLADAYRTIASGFTALAEVASVEAAAVPAVPSAPAKKSVPLKVKKGKPGESSIESMHNRTFIFLQERQRKDPRVVTSAAEINTHLTGNPKKGDAQSRCQGIRRQHGPVLIERQKRGRTTVYWLTDIGMRTKAPLPPPDWTIEAPGWERPSAKMMGLYDNA